LRLEVGFANPVASGKAAVKNNQPTGFQVEACRDGRRGIAGILGGRRRSRPSRGERLKAQDHDFPTANFAAFVLPKS
jgi:hypothetical protein